MEVVTVFFSYTVSPRRPYFRSSVPICEVMRVMRPAALPFSLSASVAEILVLRRPMPVGAQEAIWLGRAGPWAAASSGG